MGRRSTQRRRRTAERTGIPTWAAVAFLVIAIAVLGGAVFLAVNPLRAQAPPKQAGPYVVVSMAGFNPSTINLTGSTAAVTFVNSDSEFHTDGGGWHQFRVEALGVDARIAPKSDKTVTLANLKPGRYEFYCDICCGGKENPAMRGVLEVTG